MARSTKCPAAWPPVRLLPPRRLTWALHAKTPRPSSSAKSLTTFTPATRLSIWLPPRFGVRSRNSSLRTGRIAARRIAAAPNPFTTRRTPTAGIRRHRLRRSSTSCRLAQIPTPWMAGRGAPAQGGANTVVAGGPSAAGWRCGAEVAEQGRVDAPAPRRSDHWARRERFSARTPAADGHHQAAAGTRRQPDRQRRAR